MDFILFFLFLTSIYQLNGIKCCPSHGVLSDSYPVSGNLSGNLKTNQALNYEPASCFVDNGSKYEDHSVNNQKLDKGRS